MSQASTDSGFYGMIGRSAKMRHLIYQIRKVSVTDEPILLLGESGTGKELAARAIHAESRRSGNEFVPVNCAAIPPELIESELFGHVKGAFTGAERNKDGLFQAAEGGSLFLDEIGELPLARSLCGGATFSLPRTGQSKVCPPCRRFLRRE